MDYVALLPPGVTSSPEGLRSVALTFWPLLHAAVLPPPGPASDHAAFQQRAELIRQFLSVSALQTLGDPAWRHAPLNVTELAYSPTMHLGACQY